MHLTTTSYFLNFSYYSKRSTVTSILIIGGHSTIGASLAKDLSVMGHDVRGVSRDASTSSSNIVVSDYTDIPQTVFHGIDLLINCVGMQSGTREEMDRINSGVALSVASRAMNSGVSHFVHLSTVKVYGNHKVISINTPLCPRDDYGESKAECDEKLAALQMDDFKITLLRLPPVYGRGAGLNIGRLVRFMHTRGFFICPINSIARSVIDIRNISMAIMDALEHKKIGAMTISDDEPMTYEKLACEVESVSGRRVRLMRLPQIFFLPLKVINQSLYSSLFEQRLVKSWSPVGKKTYPGNLYEFVKNVLNT